MMTIAEMLLYGGFGLMAGGLWQGAALKDPDVPFLDAVAGTIAYLGLRSAAGYLMLTGHLAFGWACVRMLTAERAPRAAIVEAAV